MYMSFNIIMHVVNELFLQSTVIHKFEWIRCVGKVCRKLVVLIIKLGAFHLALCNRKVGCTEVNVAWVLKG